MSFEPPKTLDTPLGNKVEIVGLLPRIYDDVQKIKKSQDEFLQLVENRLKIMEKKIQFLEGVFYGEKKS